MRQSDTDSLVDKTSIFQQISPWTWLHVAERHYLPRDATHSAAYAVERCLSVCLYVTFRHCVKTVKHIIEILSSPNHSIVLPELRLCFNGRLGKLAAWRWILRVGDINGATPYPTPRRPGIGYWYSITRAISWRPKVSFFNRSHCLEAIHVQSLNEFPQHCRLQPWYRKMKLRSETDTDLSLINVCISPTLYRQILYTLKYQALWCDISISSMLW